MSQQSRQRNAMSSYIIAKPRTGHHQFLLRAIGFQRKLRSDHATLSYAKALTMTRRQSIKTINRKQRLLSAGGGGTAKKGAIT